mmetsp:Transcript_18629/g.35165  ORF Transcript_18629/g.35165 Transcript_18629/m.35165 type:complete len:80 (-) Transcript_18629:636-875(-)
MSRDKLGRFKQSKEFEELMQQVGGYEVNARLRFKGGKKRGGSRIELKIHEPEATIPAPQSGRGSVVSPSGSSKESKGIR